MAASILLLDRSIFAGLATFVAASIAVWFAGAHLVRYVDIIADRTNIGQAFAGMFLLGGITALPEIAAVSGASALGNAPLSISNLLGSVSMNLVLICIADAAWGQKAITSAVPGPATLLQGALGILALALTAVAIATGDQDVLGVGIWSVVLFAFVIFSFWLTSRYAKRSPWRARRSVNRNSHTSNHNAEPQRLLRIKLARLSLARLTALVALLGVVILIAGFFLSRAAETIAAETMMGSNFVGLVFVGFATALPELSSIMAAVRLERFEMAISDVFGANLFNVGLILLADATFPGGPILNSAGRFEIIAALLGILLTGIYLVGLLEREDRTIFRMGYDSFAVLCVYLAGIVLLYFVSQRT
jgi:cation:H+ antiporter